MHFENKRYGCKILLHEASFICANPVLIKSYSGFSFQQYKRWQWFFRYLSARYQVANPRRMVELRQFSYYHVSTEEEKKIRLKNKLRSAKAQVTKWSNKMEAYKAAHVEYYPLYQKAVAKVHYKKMEVERLKNELDQL